MELEQYAVYMEWDSYPGSPFRETSTAWIYAYSEQDVCSRARSQYGHHKGFEIKFVSRD